jgi:hypothetical protein
VRTPLVIIGWNEPCENQAPKGAPQVSPARQRWESGKKDSSPGGTTEFSPSLSPPRLPCEGLRSSLLMRLLLRGLCALLLRLRTLLLRLCPWLLRLWTFLRLHPLFRRTRRCCLVLLLPVVKLLLFISLLLRPFLHRRSLPDQRVRRLLLNRPIVVGWRILHGLLRPRNVPLVHRGQRILVPLWLRTACVDLAFRLNSAIIPRHVRRRIVLRPRHVLLLNGCCGLLRTLHPVPRPWRHVSTRRLRRSLVGFHDGLLIRHSAISAHRLIPHPANRLRRSWIFRSHV